jgi:hypothetical protein
MTEDAARVTVSVAVPPSVAFEIFTSDIDRWWRRGVQFRHAGRRSGFIRLEPGIGGRLFESIDGDAGLSSVRPDHPARHGREGAEFYRMIGLWWGEQMGSLREHVRARGPAPVVLREHEVAPPTS